MSGRYAENTDFLTHEADDFVIQMQARLENLQKIDFMERDRCFYKKQIIALQKDAEAAHKRMSLLQSQKDAMETRRDLLGDETIDEAALTERKEEIERLRKRIEQDETEAQKLEDKLDYLEDLSILEWIDRGTLQSVHPVHHGLLSAEVQCSLVR